MKNFAFVISILFFSNVALAEADGAAADRNIKCLDASQFPNLPANGKKAIEIKKCQVLQAFISKAAHNIIKGNFANKKSTDWAILCSNGGKSSIFVGWESETPYPSV